jgi:hypothetical protein
MVTTPESFSNDYPLTDRQTHIISLFNITPTSQPTMYLTQPPPSECLRADMLALAQRQAACIARTNRFIEAWNRHDVILAEGHYMIESLMHIMVTPLVVDCTQPQPPVVVARIHALYTMLIALKEAHRRDRDASEAERKSIDAEMQEVAHEEQQISLRCAMRAPGDDDNHDDDYPLSQLQ